MSAAGYCPHTLHHDDRRWERSELWLQRTDPRRARVVILIETTKDLIAML